MLSELVGDVIGFERCRDRVRAGSEGHSSDVLAAPVAVLVVGALAGLKVRVDEVLRTTLRDDEVNPTRATSRPRARSAFESIVDELRAYRCRRLWSIHRADAVFPTPLGPWIRMSFAPSPCCVGPRSRESDCSSVCRWKILVSYASSKTHRDSIITDCFDNHHKSRGGRRFGTVGGNIVRSHTTSLQLLDE